MGRTSRLPFNRAGYSMVSLVRMHPTLHIVKGEITFQLQETTIKCQPGDRLLLPANTLHASNAGAHGCLYVIATRLAPNIPNIQEVSEVGHG